MNNVALICSTWIDSLIVRWHLRQTAEQGHPMLPGIVMMVSLLFTAPAFAFDTLKLGQVGSLPLQDMQGVIAKSPKLKREVDEAVAKLDKKPNEIMCSGMRFPGAWKELAGVRVAPYACPFGDRWLQVRTKVRVTAKGGKVYPGVSKEAMRRAEDVRETDPTWTWSDKEPSQP